MRRTMQCHLYFGARSWADVYVDQLSACVQTDRYAGRLVRAARRADRCAGPAFPRQSAATQKVRSRRGQASGPDWRATQAATWARELNPSLVSMLATCRATVAWLITSSSAIARLLRPLAISAAISRSRGVSVDGTAPAAGAWPAAGPATPLGEPPATGVPAGWPWLLPAGSQPGTAAAPLADAASGGALIAYRTASSVLIARPSSSRLVARSSPRDRRAGPSRSSSRAPAPAEGGGPAADRSSRAAPARRGARTAAPAPGPR